MSVLTVVYLDSTRNVLAAVTRAAPPGAAEPASTFVGNSLPVRAVGLTSTHFALPVTLLAAATVDDTLPGVVIEPQAFQLVDDPQNKALHQVTPFPQATTTSPTVGLALDTIDGAVVTLQNVTPGTSLQAVVVLQNVTTQPQAARILAKVNVTDAGTPVAPSTDFAPGETWEFSAFVSGMPPNAISQIL
jgi:hypothetical protein